MICGWSLQKYIFYMPQPKELEVEGESAPDRGVCARQELNPPERLVQVFAMPRGMAEWTEPRAGREQRLRLFEASDRRAQAPIV